MSGVISFDLDGVLANFTRGFTRVANELFGTPVSDYESEVYWLQNWPALQLTEEQVEQAWAEVLKDPYFWCSLDPYNPSVMWRINDIKNKVFITNRSGIDPKGQTQAFLERWGIGNPDVYVAADKAPIAVELDVVAHIDDYPKNVVDIQDAIPDAYVALFRTSSNREFQEKWPNVVLSVDQFIDECEKRGLVDYGDETDNH